jgi:DNA-directed RNA polymerase specialized sigma24 family protein
MLVVVCGCRGHPGGFDTLIDEIRARLLPALVSKWGIEVGSDLSSDVEEYAWEYQRKVIGMDNPLGYLSRVAQSKSRRHVRWMSRTTFLSRFPDIVHEDSKLHDTLQLLAGLKPDQRVCVMLVHAFGWTHAEVAELLGVTRAVVNHHVHRGITRLCSTALTDPLCLQFGDGSIQMLHVDMTRPDEFAWQEPIALDLFADIERMTASVNEAMERFVAWVPTTGDFTITFVNTKTAEEREVGARTGSLGFQLAPVTTITGRPND